MFKISPLWIYFKKQKRNHNKMTKQQQKNKPLKV